MATIIYYGWYDDKWGVGPVYTLSTSPSLGDTSYEKSGGVFGATGTVSEIIDTKVKFSNYNNTKYSFLRDSSYDESVVVPDPTPNYVSNLSDGTNTYVIKDSEARATLATKQDTLVSGTNIKTINNNSLLGSGNLDLNGLPSQTGHSGKVLTTNGTTASWQKQYAMVIVDYTA